ncbi:MAG: efflux RND transporter permease subunit [Halobacteriovoraceae bacterium]|jgi:CzcA family heavy metal efflux pump|nr:efflux RND transporter permease subunit [Halobacteriovoraceae bacterium]
MLDIIIKFSLKNRGLIILSSIVLTLYGAFVASNLPIDVFPNLNRPTVTIMTESHGLAPEEVETLVTFPIEVAVNGTPGVRRIRSSSGVGLSIVWMEFDWGTDIYRNRQLVSEKLSLVQESLPKDVKPIMGPISSIMGEIQLIGLSSSNKDIQGMDLRNIADWTIRPRLLAINGIAQIIPIGGGVKQFHVLLDSQKLRNKNLSIEEVQENLQHISENTTGGFVNINKKEFLIRNLGRVETIDDIKTSVVGSFQGVAVRVSDIATVKIGKQVMRGDASIDGKGGVILGVKKQPGTSTLELTKKVDKALTEISKSLPAGVEINKNLFKQSIFIDKAVKNVEEALIDGAVLVTIILFLFLMNFRTTLITLTAIPVSFAITAIFFKYFEMEINTMTLGGLAIAIGLLVDDAIVDVENVYRRLKENNQKTMPATMLRVVYDASKEVRSSIVFATIIVVLTFIPLFFMGGLGGRFFTPLGVSFIVSLFASMIVSLTLTPVLCSYLLPGIKNLHSDSETKFVNLIKKFDKRIVAVVIDRPSFVIIPSLLMLIISLLLVPGMNKEFLPKFNEGTAMISVTLPPGVSLEYSSELGKKAEDFIKSIDEVKHVSRRTGRAELDEHAEGVNVSELDVDFFHGKGRDRAIVLNEIRERLLAILPGANINLGQPISHRLDHMLSGVNAEIALKIFGPDRNQLKILANLVYQTINKVDGLVDAQIETQVEIPQIKTYFIREDAQKYNINIGKIADQMETALQGENVAQVIEGQKVTNVFVRLSDTSRSSIEKIQNIIVKVMPSGEKVTLAKIADVYEASGPNMINRENMQRRIVVQANVNDRGLDKVITDIKKNIENNVKFPEGYYITYGGQFESQQKASRIMIVFGILSILAVFLLLYSHFKSALLSLMIMMGIPLAVIGSVFAIYISDNTISIASIVAFVALCGIASRNGILMISHYLHLMVHEDEVFSKEMVMRGTLERLVPVLMTALAAILGLVPLLLAHGDPGKEILYPVATVIVGGLFSSTLLDMWVTPAVFYKFGKKAALHHIKQINKQKDTL